ncbi:MAG TPA: RHS repeat-associated core domain-containing protein [Lunatimonas sp.]|nr:RHS repeat-associated core domain-containing protein [Lunatimonas sp.]
MTIIIDSTYRYGFNGKELDDSGEWGGQNNYDYGFRIYNPSIAKFLSEDPLTASYPMLTPYQFGSNTPIQAIDLDGLEAIFGSQKDAEVVCFLFKWLYSESQRGLPLLVTG